MTYTVIAARTDTHQRNIISQGESYALAEGALNAWRESYSHKHMRDAQGEVVPALSVWYFKIMISDGPLTPAHYGA